MTKGNILIADDDAAIRTVLNQALARAGYSPRATGNAATLWQWASQGEVSNRSCRRSHRRDAWRRADYPDHGIPSRCASCHTRFTGSRITSVTN